LYSHAFGQVKSGIKGESGSLASANGGLNKLPATQTAGRICQSEACREAGLALYESINFTVNPCDDFFEFACGNWNDKHPIPDDKSNVGTFNLLDEELTTNMRQILESPLKARSADSNTSLAKSVEFALDLYKVNFIFYILENILIIFKLHFSLLSI